ncbi:MAG: PRC-barrel domain-containing protein [Opitutales bacterium]|nr:PRC-barrel domain-containing protein [Opitutales bacterium]
MKMYHKKPLSIAGIAAALTMAAPFSVVTTNAQQDRSSEQWGQSSEMQDRSSQTHPGSPLQSFDYTKGVSEFIGLDVQTSAEEDFGKIGDIYIDVETGKVMAVLVTTGTGMFRRSGPRYLLSLEDLHWDSESEKLRTELTKDQLSSAQRYRTLDTSVIDNVQSLSKGTSAQNQPQSEGRRSSAWDESERQSSSSAAQTRRSVDQDAGERQSSESTAQTRRSSYQGDSERQASVPAEQRVAVSDLLKMDIKNSRDDKIGSIDELYLDLQSQHIIGVVVSTGGFLGIGAHQNVLALSQVDYDEDNQLFRANLTREQLLSAPAYTKDNDSWYTALQESFERDSEMTRSERSDRSAHSDRSTQSEGDRSTALSQGNSSADIKMTADIRKEIQENTEMSSRAQNVTITTKDDKVLLRGNVDSESEKSQIEEIAKNNAGSNNVTNELVVQAR